MKFGMTAVMGVLTLVALAAPSNAGFDLSIGNISVNGSGGAFSIIATATSQTEVVDAYTLKLNLTDASAGDLPVTFAEGPGAPAGITVLDFNNNNVITAFNGTGDNVGGNTIGFSASSLANPPLSFTLGVPTVVGTFTFTTNNAFSAGDYIDVGFVIGGGFADTQFALNGVDIPVVAIGGTNQVGNNPTVATSTRIAAVPEPSTLGVVGLIGFGLATRRRRKA